MNAPRAEPTAFGAALAGVLMLSASMGIARFAYTPMLPEMRQHFDWTLAQAGDVASANFLGYALGALVASAMVRRHNKRRWLLWSLLLSVVTTGGGALVVDYPGWLALRFVSGVASAFTMVLGAAVVLTYLASRRRGELYGVYFAGVGAGMVISVLVLEAVAWPNAGWAWAGLGGVSALLAVLAARTLRRVPDATASPPHTEHAARAVPTAALVRLVLAYGLFGFGYVVTATFLIAMVPQYLHRGPGVEPVAWILVGLVAAPSVTLWQRFSEKLGIYRALRIALVVEAAGVMLAGVSDAAIAVVVGGAILGATFMGITAMGLNVARRDGGARDAMLGWMTASFGLGQLLGPAVAARLSAASGDFMLASLLAGALLLLGAGLLLGMRDE